MKITNGFYGGAITAFLLPQKQAFRAAAEWSGIT